MAYDNLSVGSIVVGNSAGSSSFTVNCGTGGANFGTSANTHTTTIGSTNSTSATTVQSGSGALNITSTNGAQTHNSGTGTMSISTDAAATTVNIATGSAAKVVTVGSTNGASSLALKYGTADFTLASATGTVISALDTGEITKPLQPAFMTELANDALNVTGNGTQYTVAWDTEIFDQNSDLSGSTFTAPITGRYPFHATIYVAGLAAAHTLGQPELVTSNRTLVGTGGSYGAMRNNNNVLPVNISFFTDMDVGDTASIRLTVSGSTQVVDVLGNSSGSDLSFWSGYLEC